MLNTFSYISSLGHLNISMKMIFISLVWMKSVYWKNVYWTFLEMSISKIGKMSIQVLCPFFNQVIWVFAINYINYLYIFSINLLYDIWTALFFSLCRLHFILLIIPSNEYSFLNILILIIWFLFCFYVSILYLYTCILIEVLFFYLSAPNGIIQVPINVFHLMIHQGHSIKYTNMFLIYLHVCVFRFLSNELLLF